MKKEIVDNFPKIATRIIVPVTSYSASKKESVHYSNGALGTLASKSACDSETNGTGGTNGASWWRVAPFFQRPEAAYRLYPGISPSTARSASWRRPRLALRPRLTWTLICKKGAIRVQGIVSLVGYTAFMAALRNVSQTLTMRAVIT